MDCEIKKLKASQSGILFTDVYASLRESSCNIHVQAIIRKIDAQCTYYVKRYHSAAAILGRLHSRDLTAEY